MSSWRLAARVGLIMGSQSDWSTLRHAARGARRARRSRHDDRIVSAHRTPERLVDYATGARARGLQVIIAGAGGAAHLPGHGRRDDHPAGARRAGAEPRAAAASTACCRSCRCPAGVPVGTLAIGRAGAVNAALLAAAILALQDDGGGARARRLARAPDRRGGRAARRTEPEGARREAGARRLHRHPRRRPARPHDRARRGPARLSLPRVRARARRPGGAGHQPRDGRRL